MKIKNLDLWNLGKSNNKDDYGTEIFRYAESWAMLMELKMSEGFKLEDIADECSHLADTNGITGFMYGCAANILSETWEYGENLRKWYNIAEQIGDEGEKANVNGGILNTALLNITFEGKS